MKYQYLIHEMFKSHDFCEIKKSPLIQVLLKSIPKIEFVKGTMSDFRTENASGEIYDQNHTLLSEFSIFLEQ